MTEYEDSTNDELLISIHSLMRQVYRMERELATREITSGKPVKFKYSRGYSYKTTAYQDLQAIQKRL